MMHMKVMVWKYQDDIKQLYWFRGRVRAYKQNLYHDYPCTEVRSTRAEALKDANKLLAKMRKV